MGLGHAPGLISNLAVMYDFGNVKCWPLSGTSANNLLSSSFTGTIAGGAIPRLLYGGYFYFDGVDDNIVLTRPVQDDFSLCCWFRSTQNAGTATNWYDGRGLLDCEVGGVTSDFGLSLGAGKLMFGTGNPDTSIISSSSYNDGNWHYVVGTRVKATGGLVLYVDGLSVGALTSTNVSSLTAATNMRIGCIQTSTNFFQGDIGLVKIYSKALTAEEVALNYSAHRNRFSASVYTPAIVSSGLLLNLDAGNPSSYSGSGTTWTDLSGNSNNGTLVNGPTFSTDNGGSILFDGSNDHVTLPNGLLTGTGDFTVTQFIKANAAENGGTTFANYPAGNLQILYGDTFTGLWLGNSSTYLSAPVPFTTNWVFIAASRTGTTTAFYINGVLQKNGSSSSTIGTAGNAFRLGTNTSAGEQFTGNISSTQVYNRALSNLEILQNFNTLRSRYGL